MPESDSSAQPPQKTEEATPPPANVSEGNNPAPPAPLPKAPSDQVVNKTKVHVDKLKTEKSFIADRQEFTILTQYLDPRSSTINLFSLRKHCVLISPDEENEIACEYLCDEQFITDSLLRLQEQHLLLVTGEPELGKTTAAIYLGYMLRSRLGDKIKGIYMVSPLERNVKIDVMELPTKKSDFENCTIIFKNAFVRSNQDLIAWLTHLDSHQLRAFSANLKQTQTFLVITADTKTIREQHNRLSQLSMARSLPALTKEQLKQGLSQKLEQFALSKSKTLAELDFISEETTERIVERLPTMPRITQFVRECIPQVTDGHFDINEAIRRFDNLRSWFLNDLAADFEAWCSVFTLALCHCLPDSAGVPWLEYDYMRRSIHQRLARDLKISQQKDFSFKDVVSEDTLLEKCRAEVYMDPTTGVDKVRFIHERYPDRLWKIILSSSRRMISLIHPLLKELAETSTIQVRARAAQILGRIGVIDPAQVINPLLESWIASDEFIRWATVGYLYQGILASANSAYQEEYLGQLLELGKGNSKKQVWTAIAAYKQIGFYNLAFALDRIKDIAEQRLTTPIENTRRIDRILNRVENTLTDQPMELIEALTLALSHELLSNLAEQVYEEEGVAIFAIQYAIVTLCLEVDPLQVLQELTRWINPEKAALGALLSLMFLQSEGIAEELEKKQVDFISDEANGITQKCNPLILSIASSSSKVEQLADFLEKVFSSFSRFFPPRTRRYLRRSFLLHLKEWAAGSLNVPKCRDAMLQLFVRLTNSKNEELSDQVYLFLQSDKDFQEQKGELYKFADDAFRLSLA